MTPLMLASRHSWSAWLMLFDNSSSLPMHSQGTLRHSQQLYASNNNRAFGAARLRPQQQAGQGRCRHVVQAKPGDVLLIAEGISKTYDGEKQLFGNLTFTVVAGSKLAIVGPNGAGKSTLLKILGKRAQHDAGTVSRKEGALVGYLPQSDLLQLEQAAEHGDMTVLQAVLKSDSQVATVVQEYQSALSAANGGITPRLEAAIEAMHTHDAWQVDSDARQKLEAVGLHDPDAKVSTLSGGQRRRLSLAAALLGNPDLLILDEPTNHMDAAMITWMEDEIKASPDMAVVMVSHDRAFMENCCTQLLELDHAGFTAMHPFGGAGSYDAFKQARAARRAAQASAAADARTVLRREAEWMARQPKARSTKAKARVDAFSELQDKARDTPPPDVKPDFGRVAMMRLGNRAVDLINVSVSTPDGSKQLLRDFSYEFTPGSRIGIAGPNGAGKSTLLDVIAGLKQPQSGHVVVGETAVVGYFQQHPPPVPDNLRLIDYIRDVAEKRKARKGDSGLTGPVDIPEVLLEKLGFPRKIQFQKVESLSGGERRRLHLAAVLASTPNVLILDEPTNDLDLSTVEVLEEMLGSYRGLLLVVSHDRSFMEGSTDDLLVLPGDGSVQRFQGQYSDYLRQRQQQATAAARGQHDQAASNGAGSTGSKGSSGSNGNGVKASSGQSKASAATQTSSSDGKGSSKDSKTGSSSGGKSSSSSSSSQAAKQSSKRTLGLFERQEYERLGKEMAAIEAKVKTGSDKLNTLNARGAPWSEVEALSLQMAELHAQYEEKEERWFELAEIAGDL